MISRLWSDVALSAGVVSPFANGFVARSEVTVPRDESYMGRCICVVVLSPTCSQRRAFPPLSTLVFVISLQCLNDLISNCHFCVGGLFEYFQLEKVIFEGYFDLDLHEDKSALLNSYSATFLLI